MRALLEVQQDPVGDTDGSTQRVEKRIAEIIDIAQQDDDAERPHKVKVLFQSDGIVGRHRDLELNIFYWGTNHGMHSNPVHK